MLTKTSTDLNKFGSIEIKHSARTSVSISASKLNIPPELPFPFPPANYQTFSISAGNLNIPPELPFPFPPANWKFRQNFRFHFRRQIEHSARISVSISAGKLPDSFFHRKFFLLPKIFCQEVPREKCPIKYVYFRQ